MFITVLVMEDWDLAGLGTRSVDTGKKGTSRRTPKICPLPRLAGAIHGLALTTRARLQQWSTRRTLARTNAIHNAE